MRKMDGEVGDWIRAAEPGRSDGGAALWPTSVQIQQRRNTKVLHTVWGPVQVPPPPRAPGPERNRNQLTRAERLRQAVRDTGWLTYGPR